MFKTAASLALAFCIGISSTSSAFDMGQSHYWGKNSGLTAMAYFKVPFDGAKTRETLHYGLALTSPLGRGKGSTFRLQLDDSRLFDLRFRGEALDSFRINERPVISRQSDGALNAHYAIDSTTGEVLSLLGIVAVVAAVVAVGDQESKRTCNGASLSDNQICVLTAVAIAP